MAVQPKPTHFGGPVQEGAGGVKTIGAATTLTDVDYCKRCVLTTSGTDGAAVTLPAPSAGKWFTFVVGAAFATTNWTVVTKDNATIINGNVVVAGAHVAGADEDTISFVATAESVGDWVHIWSDGTSWFVSGSGVTTGSITLTDAA